MTLSSSDEASESLGEILERGRRNAGLSFGALSEQTGIARGQLFKLERDHVKKVNPAQLAVLAEPLGLSLYQLYSAAGYSTPSALSHLGEELEDKLRQLPPDAVARLETFVDRLASEHGYDFEGASGA